jgi:hypothetical protein
MVGEPPQGVTTPSHRQSVTGRSHDASGGTRELAVGRFSPPKRHRGHTQRKPRAPIRTHIAQPRPTRSPQTRMPSSPMNP